MQKSNTLTGLMLFLIGITSLACIVVSKLISAFVSSGMLNVSLKGGYIVFAFGH